MAHNTLDGKTGERKEGGVVLDDKQIDVLTTDQKEELLNELGEKYGVDIAEQLKISNRADHEVDEEYLRDIGTTKSELNFDIFTKAIMDTDHLNLYDEMDEDLGLEGESYNPFKKWLWYYHNSIMQNVKSYKINKNTIIDNRKHGLIISPPSGGKTTIKNQIKRLSKRLWDSSDVDKEMACIEVSGVSHPEQLVGKIKYTGRGDKKTPVTVYGLCGYIICMNDEAQDMINEKNDVYAKSQRIKRIAMDTYGENQISKKLTDDKPEEALEYYSPTRFFDFVHPKKLESPFFDTGSFRRYEIFNLIHDPEISLDDVTQFQLDDVNDYKEKYTQNMRDYYEKQRHNVVFNNDCAKIISHFHACLLHYMLNHKNKNVFRYGLLTRYSLRSMFSKNVYILSIARNEKTPSFNTIMNGCCDTLLFIFKSIESINDLGDMGISSDVWGGLLEEDAQACEFLMKRGALSFESSNISIKEFQTVLGHLYGCKTTQSRKYYYKLKRDGFISSKQSGKYDSRVWLKFIPKDSNLDSDNFKPLEIWKEYFKGVTPKQGCLTPLIDDFTHKIEEITKGDEGVGVLGCVLFNKLYMHQSKKSLFFNNIYNTNEVNLNKGYPDTVTPSSPLTKQTHSTHKSVIKTQSKGVKHPKMRVTPLKKSKVVKNDRQVQFWEAPECDNIKEQCTKNEVLEWCNGNPKHTFEEMFDKLGHGSPKHYNELKESGDLKC